MRGQRAALNENGDGEVDEHFWAQAAADQAAGRAGSDGDEGRIHPVRLSRQCFDHINSTVVQPETGAESHSIPSSSMTMTTMAPASTTALTVAWSRPPTQESRICLRRR